MDVLRITKLQSIIRRYLCHKKYKCFIRSVYALQYHFRKRKRRLVATVIVTPIKDSASKKNIDDIKTRLKSRVSQLRDPTIRSVVRRRSPYDVESSNFVTRVTPRNSVTENSPM